MKARLADRLRQARQQFFVGREGEVERFAENITAENSQFLVFHVFGPGGIGKTSLLRQFSMEAEHAGCQVVYLDGRSISPSPDAFQEAWDSAISSSDKENRLVLLIDTYEAIAGLDRWLRESFIPELGEDSVVVIAGRQAPASIWRTDPGWQSVLCLMPLRNLSHDESRDFLERRDVPEDQHPKVLGFTHGHPLALSLVADVAAQHPSGEVVTNESPDIVQTLLMRLIESVPSPQHRLALEACAFVRFTTESLLSILLDEAEVREIFEWLRALSFIDSGRSGLFPHDLAREVLMADLRWRNPEVEQTLHKRARQYYGPRLKEVAEDELGELLTDYVYLHRDNPVVRPIFDRIRADWEEQAEQTSLIDDAARPADLPALTAMVQRHEGEESAKLAAYWLERHPEGTRVFRDEAGKPQGFIMVLPILPPAELGIDDPALTTAHAHLNATSPLRGTERGLFFRYWMSKEDYQDISAVQSLCFIHTMRVYMTTPHLAYTFFPSSNPDAWAFLFAYADLNLIAEAGFTVGEKDYGVFGHDWRVTPPNQWLDLLADRTPSSMKAPTTPRNQPTLLVLSESDFAEAVRTALRDFTRPERLKTNPLLQSRLIIDQTGEEADTSVRIEKLLVLLQEAAEPLKPHPRRRKFFDALNRTYFKPAPSQEIAAEQLNLPYSTFRRHLKSGVTHITESLWKLETGGISS